MVEVFTVKFINRNKIPDIILPVLIFPNNFLDASRKLNVYKAFRGSSGRLPNLFYSLNFRLASRWRIWVARYHHLLMVKQPQKHLQSKKLN